jgi:hypothetical protein
MTSPDPGGMAIELDVFPLSESYTPGAPGAEAAEPLLSLSESPPSIDSSHTGNTQLSRRLLSLLTTSAPWPGNKGSSRDSKVVRLLRMLELDSEPGLTNAQMFLTNHDLKPVEEARRKWGSWSFVGVS